MGVLPPRHRCQKRGGVPPGKKSPLLSTRQPACGFDSYFRLPRGLAEEQQQRAGRMERNSTQPRRKAEQPLDNGGSSVGNFGRRPFPGIRAKGWPEIRPVRKGAAEKADRFPKQPHFLLGSRKWASVRGRKPCPTSEWGCLYKPSHLPTLGQLPGILGASAGHRRTGLTPAFSPLRSPTHT